MKKICCLSILFSFYLLSSLILANESGSSQSLATYSVSEVSYILEQNSSELIDKEIILSSCGIDVLECNDCDSQAFVKHQNDPNYIKENPNKSFDQTKSLRVYGTEIQRSLGTRIGYNRCGLYKGKIQNDPYHKNSKQQYIFVVEEIIEQHLSEREQKRRQKQSP